MSVTTLLLILAGLIVFGAIIGFAYGLGTGDKEKKKEATKYGALTGAGCFFWLLETFVVIAIFVILIRSCSS